ncbi:MAG: DUF1801 domain-containing protein [Candidatus Acidiferrales bacterium]
MSEPKTKATDASVAKFLAKIPDAKRREDCLTIVKLMKAATGEEPVLWGTSIVGFGRYRLQYAGGREAEWPIIGFSPRKNDLTLYVGLGSGEFKDLLGQLGKHKAGKGCLYLKGLDGVDQATLKKIMEESVKAKASKRVKD